MAHRPIGQVHELGPEAHSALPRVVAAGRSHAGSTDSRLHIHESADAAASLAFWSQVVEAPPSQFGRTTFKTHNPKTVRKDVGDDYHGCLVVYVRRSADLCLRIEGWCEGLAAVASGTLGSGSGVVQRQDIWFWSRE